MNSRDDREHFKSLDFEEFSRSQREWAELPQATSPSRDAVTKKDSKRERHRRKVDKAVGTNQGHSTNGGGVSKTAKEKARIPRVSPIVKPKASKASLASSQHSFYEGDDEFDKLMAAYDQAEEVEVEKLVEVPAAEKHPAQSPLRTSSVLSTQSFSSVSTNFSTATTISTAPTSANPSRTSSYASGNTPDHSKTMPADIHTATPPTPQSPSKIRRTTGSTSGVRVRTEVEPCPLTRKRSTLASSPEEIDDPFVTDHSSEASTARQPSAFMQSLLSNVPHTENIGAKTIDPRHNPNVTSDDPDYVIIAHEMDVQQAMEARKLPWAVQWEIARGISQGTWSWSDVTESKLDKLKGSNAEAAPLVAETIRADMPASTPRISKPDVSVLVELDREQDAILENRGRGLGLMGPWREKEKWYGGRIQQVARLSKSSKGKYEVRLGELEHRRSNRFARFLGSRHLLQLRIDKKLVTAEHGSIAAFVARRLLICGRIFYPFHAKDDRKTCAVYFVEVNKNFERCDARDQGDHLRLSWEQFMDWHNPLKYNRDQPMSKWSTRWALGLSTSVPVLEFNQDDIYYIGDEVATVDPPTGKPGAYQIMTDGCGFINQAALFAIAQVFGAKISVAVQGRIAGAKGVWVLHPNAEHRNLTDPPKIWIRASQNKINLPPNKPLDRSHRIFDLVRLTRLTTPSYLYAQTIMNMSHNGVEDSVFKKLFEDRLREEIEPLTNWNTPDEHKLLVKAVADAGKIVGSRMRREAGFSARALGYIRDDDNGSDEEPDVDEGEYNRGLVDRNPESGCPSTLHESIIEMLEAGFTPKQSPFLRDKIKWVVKSIIDSHVGKFHIPIAQSVEAFVVPDPFGILEEDQVYFRSSEPIRDPTQCLDPNSFIGEVLLTRNPTRVASDVRKVVAVQHDRLLTYVNVIVCPTKGRRSLASWLGGGDYDGDTVTIIADPSLVSGFSNPKFTQEPEKVMQSFKKEVERIPDFLTRVERMTVAEREKETIAPLLLGLFDSKVGLYSSFHENAVYVKGYDHPDTIRLAYTFTTCLDSAKTGLRIAQERFNMDSRKFGGDRPTCMQSLTPNNAGSLPSWTNKRPPERDLGLGKFILDVLLASGKKLKDELLAQYEHLPVDHHRADVQLLKPLVQMEAKVSYRNDLALLKKHIEKVFDSYRDEMPPSFALKSPRKQVSGGPPSRKPTSRSGASNIAKPHHMVVRDLAARFNKAVDGVEPDWFIPFIKASYAYKLAMTESGTLASSFPFDMAHKWLMILKSMGSEYGAVSSTADFADLKVQHAGIVRAQTQARVE
ncbi:hypothetical protein BD410DRAFT_763609 [Rickenella mellea]|uniref:RNA-dependent RNA polymerase n=1 Tax=Rickenella mellea TaxID=50990 RepID=A0A4Y7QHS3_9AGAM|nr:hypothetical protein BD410DRAFT_763609 [Rickenella mellea]